MQGQNTGKTTLSIKDRMTRALLDYVQPTHFITLSLCQARKFVAAGGMESWAQGDDVIYQQVHEAFMRSLSKRLTRRAAWDRYQPIIPNACAIEGGKGAERFHLHLLVAKPEHVTETRFRMAVCVVADGNPWVMNGNHSVDIQQIQDHEEAKRKAFYTLKRGIDRICL